MQVSHTCCLCAKTDNTQKLFKIENWPKRCHDKEQAFCSATGKVRPKLGRSVTETFFYILLKRASLGQIMQQTLSSSARGCQMVHVFSNQKSQFG
jgi:hypothetical protein